MSDTPIRSIRVDDITWLHAREVADFYDTTVSALVVQYLKALRIGQKPVHTVVREVNRVAPVKRISTRPQRERPGTLPATRPRPASDRVKADPATCTHPIQKEVPYGTFCTACGAKTVAKR